VVITYYDIDSTITIENPAASRQDTRGLARLSGRIRTYEQPNRGMRIMIIQARWIIFLALLAGAAIKPAIAAEWQLVPDSSNVRFIGVQEGSSFRGRFENFTAMIDFDPANPTAGKIIGVVKMDSGKSGDAERDATLLEDDWFDPENYPESRFESERIEQMDDGTFAAHGELTMIGVSKPVILTFEFKVSDSTANFSGNFEIKRLDFGMGWDATNWIADEVAVQVRLKLQQ
jgi:polyisoprenoid-binding protein YceI